jgi:hypothetical protein
MVIFNSYVTNYQRVTRYGNKVLTREPKDCDFSSGAERVMQVTTSNLWNKVQTPNK